MGNNFYRLPNKKRWKDLILDSETKSFKKWCDKLDCSISVARQPTDKTIQDVLNISDLYKFNHWTFIIRKDPFEIEEPYIEVGLSTSDSDHVVYLIWIHCDIKYLDYFINEYGIINIG